MPRATKVRAFFALAILVMSTYIAATVPPRLGLDLRGGTQIVLETRDSPTAKADRDATDRALEVLRRRVDALGVSEPDLVRSGDRRIIVQLPGVQEPRRAAEVLGRTAQLTFHPVLEVADTTEATTSPDAGGRRILPDESGRMLTLDAARMTGADVDRAEALLEPAGGGWHVTLDLRGRGERAWAELTGDAACAPPGTPARRVAIVLDGKVVSSPQVDPSVGCDTGILGGSTRITGDFDKREARELALLINGGALPVPVETVEHRTVGPTLGEQAIEAGMWAAIIGAALTALFIACVYRLLGILAAVALAGYGLIAYAALVGLGATLTLPGLAGFVLAVGMAVDANVLVFERAREEYLARTAPALRPSLTRGFRNAFGAVADSNVTTLIAAGLLFFLATGPVRGFGVTLGIGVLASMVSALVVTRVLAEFAVSQAAVRRRPRISGIAHAGPVREWLARRDPHLMRHRRRVLAVSGVLALGLAVSGVAVRGVDFGVEFTGGRLVEYSTAQSVDPDRARSALADAGFPKAVVQTSGDRELTVRTGKPTDAEEARITATVDELGGGAEKVRDEFIGPSLGRELRLKAVIALGIALAAQLAYLAVRFRWTFGVAAVVSMAHDVLILVGAFAWLGRTVDAVFLAALLTVIGYSVNDSVVVFDRIRELRRTPAHGKRSLARITDTAVLQTLPRTVNTGSGALFVLVTLAVLGGDSLADFALALLIGVVAGTCSTVSVAAPLAVVLESRATPSPPRAARSRTSPDHRGHGPRRPGHAPRDNGARV
ncbi:protein translocase subunit SecD [Embleya sp. NPDC050154]|uniref:protein translocase subunit SecD n=1 Tax=Embleya sp. NPDC050154 TaxID=3363988 RepID=UPI00378A95F0